MLWGEVVDETTSRPKGIWNEEIKIRQVVLTKKISKRFELGWSKGVEEGKIKTFGLPLTTLEVIELS